MKPLIPRRYIVEQDVRVVDTTTGDVVSLCAHRLSAEAMARKLNLRDRTERAA